MSNTSSRKPRSVAINNERTADKYTASFWDELFEVNSSKKSYLLMRKFDRRRGKTFEAMSILGTLEEVRE
jgi:hypothetical protein